MTDRLGTCQYAQQQALVESVPAQPHQQAYSEAWPEIYICSWLDWVLPDDMGLPPAVARYNSTFELRSGDCEACPHYRPAGGNISELLQRAKETAMKSRRPVSRDRARRRRKV